MPAVVLGRRRGAKQPDQVVGVVGVASPHLGTIDQPAALGLARPRRSGKQIGTRSGLAHADGKAHFATADARQYVLLDAFVGILEEHGAALTVGDEVEPHRRVGDPELLGNDVTLQKTAFMPTVLFGPGHADPALLPDLAAERGAEAVIISRLLRIVAAGGDFLVEKGAHLLA